MQFAKLFLAALVFALGVIACSGGGGGSSGGGGGGGNVPADDTTANIIPPTTFDLSVTGFNVSSSSMVAGDVITLSATVGNDESATAFSFAATLRYYRSSDATIDATDTEVDTDSIDALAADATSAQTATDSPTVAGTYYYGVCIVASGDSDTSNDCSTGVQVDVAARDFDLSVTAFSVSKSSIVAGEAITLNATVTNDSSATASSPVAALKYYRSTDATIDATDTEVGTADSIGALAAATESKTAIVNPSTAGTFYYGACVVATGDSDTSNDCSAGMQVNVAAQEFDLSVTAFSVALSSIVAGDAITFSATVTNDASATVSSSVAALKYYRSTDATIDSTADTEVGTAASIGALAAAATESETAIVNPSTAGTFYYGACVVATGDSDTSNDCSTGVQVDVAARDFDLSVTAFSVSKSSIVASEAITLNATVTNDSSATASSPVAALKYYRSTDATIDATDTEVGTADSIGALAAAATESKTAIVNPSTAGTFYYGACVVATGDSDTSNDCSAGMQVNVAAQEFDLSVTAFSVALSSIVAGDAITFSATVTNDASATVSSSVAALKYYRSPDATIDSTTDTEVGTADSISALAAAATESETAIVNPSTAGTFYYGACVVATGDSDTSNDCSTGVQVDVAARDFDLSVTAFSVSPSSIVAGEAITFSATVTNDASATVSSSVAALKYYRSTDATIDSTTDTEVGTADSINALAAAATESKTAIVNPSTAGTFYYGACVVATGDSDTSNDCSAGMQVNVAAQEFDLSVTAFSVALSSIVAGDAITFSATVTNDASATVSSSVAALKYYRSTDATIDSTADTEVGTADSIGALAAAATESETAIVNPSTAGTFYYGACVVGAGDSDTSNDCSVGVQVDVAARDFDLSVTAFSVSPSSIVAGEAITFSATVTNDASATVSSSVAALKYYRSTDATIDSTTDTEVGTADSINALAAAATESKTAIVNPSTAGTFYYGACVVATGDSDTSNDCSAGMQVNVAAQEFDLSVTAFSVALSSIVAGDAITFSATVTNDASATVSSSVAALKYYRSTDATIDSTADTEVGTAASIGALAAAATESETAIVNPSTAGTFYYGACVVATGDSDTSNDCSTGVQVDVAAQDFDLSVTAFSVSDSSVLTNERIWLNATVGNDSSATVSSPAATLRYYRSTDATITSADTEVGTADSISALAASATETRARRFLSPSTAGTFYYGACVVSAGDSDTSNDCSAGVQVVVATQDFDLSVTAFSIRDASAARVGSRIWFDATVGNDLSATVSSPVDAVLSYYRSSDATISSSDARFSRDFISVSIPGTFGDYRGLAAGETINLNGTEILATAGTHYYYACIFATGDSDTSNDCSAVVQVDVAARDFDLSVTAFSVSDTSVVVGDDITFTATVRNDASALHSSPASAFALRYYRSSDSAIDTTDSYLGYRSVTELAAGATETVIRTLRARDAGTYYYGACAEVTGDSDTSNDCSASVRVDVVAEPDFDLSVIAFSVSESSVLRGEPITLSVTVGNDSSATTSSRVATLRYYRSPDATITSADTEVGVVDSISALAVAATESETAIVNPSTAGTFYYGACVVATGDSDTSNDCSAGMQVNVAAQEFDLSVTAFSVAPSSIVAGDAITFAATVTNDSSATVSSSVAELKYYRSTDATIDSTADTEVGTADSISALAAAATESKTAIVNPSIAGTFYYGACIVASGDSDTSNDCSAGVRVDVGQDFDLSVTAFSVSDSSVAVNEPITFTATVGNHALAIESSPAATLRYYRSTNATITSADTEVGTADSISALAASATESETASVTVPSTIGTYYYGACVVAAGDSDTSNDCSAGVRVDVVEDFDLSVTAFSVEDASAARVGSRIQFNATVGNDLSATASSPAIFRDSLRRTGSVLSFYRSSDATISSSDIGFDRGTIGELAAGETENESGSEIPGTAGTYYYYACIFATGDSDTSNDCSAVVQVDVAARDFDLSVTAFSVSDTPVVVGHNITFTATVRNDASALHSSPASAFALRYYRSSDSTIETTDTYLGYESVTELAAGATETILNILSADSSSIGTYYYGACIRVTGDSDASNNCSAGVQVVVVKRDFDLSVTAFSVSDTSVFTSDSITFSATVHNDSSATHSSLDSRLLYYRSSDATVTRDDTFETVRGISELAAGETSSAYTESTAAPSAAGTYYYGVCVRSKTGDSDTSNDCSAGVQVVVVERDFDLSVTAFSVSVRDTSVSTIVSMTLTATVRNDASALHSSPATAILRYRRSSDATIDTTDSYFGGYMSVTDRSVTELAAGATETIIRTIHVWGDAGTYYYGACIEVTGDSDTGNDCSTGVQAEVAASSP